MEEEFRKCDNCKHFLSVGGGAWERCTKYHFSFAGIPKFACESYEEEDC
jgi:hypothetical protein